MKFKILILFLLFFFNLYSQKIEKKIGEFKIKKESFIAEGKKKITKSVYYFDSSGKIIEKIKYGRHHFNKLKVIGEIEQFKYSNDKLELSTKYTSYCKDCEYNQFYTIYKYNFENKLISEKTYGKENDSLFMSIEYDYKPNLKEIHFNSSTYYENKYDDEERIIEQNQKFEETNKIRWKKEYKYTKYNRVSKFQTYYGDGNERSQIEIITYDSDKKIISKETIQEKSKTKLYYFYNNKGMVEKIEEYENFTESNYELKYITNFKIIKKYKAYNKIVIDKINQQLLDE